MRTTVLTLATAGAVTAALLTAPAARAATSPAWRASMQHESLRHGSRLLTVGKTTWAFGGRGYRDGRATAFRREGPTWRQVALPSQARGEVVAADAGSASDVWAATLGTKNGQPVAMRFDGRRWKTVQTLGNTIVTAVTVVGPRNVWVFGTDGPTDRRPVAWHGTPRGWKKTTMPFVVWSADLRSGRDLWAVGWRSGGGPVAGRFDGKRWRSVPDPRGSLPAALRDPAKAQLVYGRLFAARGTLWLAVNASIWSAQRTDAYLLRFDGKRWRSERLPKRVAWHENGSFVPDGKGGLWMFASTGDYRSFLFRRTASGSWSSSPVKGTGLQYVELADLAPAPGGGLLGSAGWETRTTATGGVLSYR
ncbi:hypothetical protein GCM10009678_02460 [Actinomadura kijaniata]|uniref:Uncharacterized protein n=1 Tax=Actinomadura namibiensis TaxID=182080 RepID=A0A7W3LU09_ACTNM|nr:hypothetical protein [Actinomadura namibiensis]MBA8954182.1 hypothetical protein [Actinomadura namibiensis]